MSFALLSLTVLSVLLQATSPAIALSRCKDKPVAAGYYAGWHATGEHAFQLSDISWERYNTLIYSFATTTPDVHNLSLKGSDPAVLPDFVAQAHAHGVDAHTSIGGWAGSLHFSSNIATPENRTAFANTVVDFAEEHSLDGINLDWEYPGKQGIGCNVVSLNDTSNLLSFLQELRKVAGDNLTISAAVGVAPFIDSTGKPSADVSDFAEVLDYVSIMNYDVWGSWSPTVGPNAPLNDSCALPADQQGSAVSAVKAWADAGMPTNKIVLGLASYGHSFSVKRTDAFVNGSTTELAPYPNFNASNQPVGDEWDDTSGVDVCGVSEKSGGSFELWGLVESGFLNADGSPAPGIYYRYDNCSQTPYVYNTTSEVMISFDNPQSFAAKGNFIKDAGLRGFAIWEAGGDYHNILIDSVGEAVGFTDMNLGL